MSIGTGTSFTTPELSETTTYYAENVTGDCTSERVTIVAALTPVGVDEGISVNGISIFW